MAYLTPVNVEVIMQSWKY